MDKKILSRLFLLSLSGALLVGCGDQATETPEDIEDPDTEEIETPEDNDSQEETTEVIARIDILINGEAVADLSQEVTAEEDMYLLDIMHENYDIEEEDGFISSIEGHEQDEDAGRYWLYYINGEMPSVGAADYELEEGDQIEWRLEDSE